jgi:hypothetical protein
MRKGILVFGALYFIYGLWLLFTVSRLKELYIEFDAELPYTSALTPVIVLFYSLALFFIYFLKLKNDKTYKILFLISLLGLVFGLGLSVMSIIFPIYNLTTSL